MGEITITPSREQRYMELVAARKLCRLCDGLTNGTVIVGGRYDSDNIGPWTRWLGDLHATVMIIGQDWGDQAAFEKQRGTNDGYSATNDMLRELLASIGVTTPHQMDAAETSGVFLTNAILCFKGDGCQGAVHDAWFSNCASRFLRPQIELVAPKAVICLGQRAFTAVLAAFDLHVSQNFRSNVQGPGVRLPNGSTAFAVYHCGRRILNTHRNRDEQMADWRRISSTLANKPPK